MKRIDLFSAVKQAAEMGAKMIVIVGGGEPLCYPHLRKLLDLIDNHGMRTLIFSNLTLITKKWAEIFWDRQIAIAGKINSFNHEIHDYLVGVKGAAKMAYQALKYLKSAGYPGNDYDKPLLAIETVILKPNFDEIPFMWRYCRDNNIIPYFEMVTEQGRMKEHKELLANPEDVLKLFENLLKIDQQEYGYNWIARPPIVSYNCTRHYFAAYLHVTGDLFPCPGLDINCGNIKDKKLAEILD
jgi:MoaA/NifB/PqqE/SkfB family radical SAM enzyme